MKQNNCDPNKKDSLQELKKSFYLFFTKKDKVMESENLLDDDNIEESKQQSKNVERAMNKIYETIKAIIELMQENKGITIHDICLFNCRNREQDIHILERFFNSFLDSQKRMNKYMIYVNLVNLAKCLLDEIIKKHGEVKFWDAVFLILQDSYDKGEHEVKNAISTFIDNISSYSKFKRNERNLFERIENILKKANKTVESKKTWNKGNFIKLILEEAKVNLMNEINSRSYERTCEIINKYVKALMEKFGHKDFSHNFNVQTSKDSGLNADFIRASKNNSNICVTEISISFICCSAAAFLGAKLGWIDSGLGFFFSCMVVLGFSVIKNYIGLYDASDCCTDTLETFCAIIKGNKNKIMEEILNSQKNVFSNMRYDWKNSSKYLADQKLREQTEEQHKKILDMQILIEEHFPKKNIIDDPRKLIKFDEFGFGDLSEKDIFEDLKKQFND